MTPTREIVYGLIRTVLMIASTSLVARGVVTQGTIEEVAGALSIIALAAYSAWAKVKLAKKVEARVTGADIAPPPGPSGTTIVTLFAAGMLALAGLTACGHLEPGGAYAPAGQQADLPFFAVDAQFKVTYSAVDAVFKWERDNEAGLWKLNHEIKHTLDKIRVESKDIAVRYARARAAYRANPTPAGLSDLQLILAAIQKLSITAQAVIPKGS